MTVTDVPAREATLDAASVTGSRGARRTTLYPFVAFLAPALVALVAFRVLPTLWVLLRSIQNATGGFVGLDNYRFLFDLPFFWHTVRTTVVFVALTVIVQIGLAFALALLLTQRLAMARLLRVLVFLPVAIPIVASSVVWGAAFRPEGLVNSLLGIIAIPPQEWINSPSQALIGLVIVTSWIGVGFWMTFLVAGLGEVPQVLYEAAVVDGAGWWQRLRNVTVPMMARPLLFVIVSDTVLATIVVAPVLILTRGGPARATNLIMFDIYERAFINRDIPLAAAQSVVLLLLLGVLVGILFAIMRSGSEQR